MKIRKYILYFFVVVLSCLLSFPMVSCKASYRNTRKISKSKKIKVKRHKYARSYSKKPGKHPVPINTKYIIKGQRRSSYHY